MSLGEIANLVFIICIGLMIFGFLPAMMFLIWMELKKLFGTEMSKCECYDSALDQLYKVGILVKLVLIGCLVVIMFDKLFGG